MKNDSQSNSNNPDLIGHDNPDPKIDYDHAHPHDVRLCRDGKRRNCFRKRTPNEVLASFRQNVNKDGPGGCWLWTGAKQPRGHGAKGFYGDFSVGGNRVLAHKFIFELVNGPVPRGLEIRHLCHEGLCVNLEHLKHGTHAENMADSVASKRFAAGDRSGRRAHPEAFPKGKECKNAILNDDLVLLIRDLHYSRLLDQTSIIRIFRVKNVRGLVTGKGWKHVSMPASYNLPYRPALHRFYNGRRHRRVNQAVLDLLQSLRRGQGLTYEEIASRTGVSQTVVYKLLKEGINPEDRVGSPTHRDVLQHEARIRLFIDRLLDEGKLDSSAAAQIISAVRAGIEVGFYSYPTLI